MKTKQVKAVELLAYPLPLILKGHKTLYQIVEVCAEGGRINCYREALPGRRVRAISKEASGYVTLVTGEDSEALLEQIGKLYGRNVSLKKGHATLTARVQELEKQLLQSNPKPVAVATGITPEASVGRQVRDADGCGTRTVGQLPRVPREKRPGDFIREMSAKLQGCEPRTARYQAQNALRQLAAEMDAHSAVETGEKIHSIVEEAVSGIKGSQTFADLSLQSAIDDLRQRVNRAEDAVKHAFTPGSYPVGYIDQLEDAITRGVAKHVDERISAIEVAMSPGIVNQKEISKAVAHRIEMLNKTIKDQVVYMLQPGGVLYDAIKLNRK